MAYRILFTVKVVCMTLFVCWVPLMILYTPLLLDSLGELHVDQLHNPEAWVGPIYGALMLMAGALLWLGGKIRLPQPNRA